MIKWKCFLCTAGDPCILVIENSIGIKKPKVCPFEIKIRGIPRIPQWEEVR